MEEKNVKTPRKISRSKISNIQKTKKKNNVNFADLLVAYREGSRPLRAEKFDKVKDKMDNYKDNYKDKGKEG